MAIITPNSASHWYRRDGSPCHTQPYADKKRAAKGETRSTHVGDARKLGLLPSVTNVLNIKSNPMLSAWSREQVLLIAARNPRMQGESDEDYVKRIEGLFQCEMDELREIGHKFHAAMEEFAHLKVVNPDNYDGADIPVDAGKAWFSDRVMSVQHTERTVVSGKYAGTLDLVCEMRSGASSSSQVSIVDYKTRRGGWARDKKTGMWKCATYEADVLQLAAYRAALCEQIGFPFDTPLMDCISLIVPSGNVPSGEIPDAYEKVWEFGDLANAKRTFDHLLDAWQSSKGYNI